MNKRTSRHVLRLTTVLLLALLSNSCWVNAGAPKTLTVDTSFDANLIEHYYSVYIDTKLAGYKFSNTRLANFSWGNPGKNDSGADLAGVCAPYQVTENKGSKAIVLEREVGAWKDVIISEKMTRYPYTPAFTKLIYHELGHCNLNLSHDESDENHIMYPFINEDNQYMIENWSILLENFFSYVPDRQKQRRLE